MKGGFIGVDIFFVISGFLISTIIFENLDRGSFNFAVFYTRRIQRIFPALLVVLAASYVFGWFALFADDYKQLGKHIAAGAGFVSNLVLWGEAGYFDHSAETKPLLHLWSLGIEEQFYLVWPLVLWLSWKARLNLLALTVVLALLSFYLNIRNVSNDPVAAFYSPQTRFWELLSGGLLAWLSLNRMAEFSTLSSKVDDWFSKFIKTGPASAQGDIVRHLLSFTGSCLLIYGFLTITKDVAFPGIWAIIPVTGSVLIILAGPGAWINRKVLSNRIAVWIGLISFPLYLWHWPLVAFFRIVEGEFPDFKAGVWIVVLSFILACLTYWFVERPFRFGGSIKVKVAVLVLSMIVIGTLGYNTYKRNGLAFRFPRMVQELGNFNFDFRTAYREGTCFLRPDQTSKDFADCETGRGSGRNALLLWGDSHAAHLYPGMVNRFGSQFNVIQLTAANCPPMLDFDIPVGPNCKKINDFVVDYLQQNSIKTVVLSAGWTSYELTQLFRTIDVLKEKGVQNIYVVGPVPQWFDGLPKQLFNHFSKNLPHLVPERMTTGLNPNFVRLDPTLRKRLEGTGVTYISPKDLLCDDKGCITRVGESIDGLMAWDYGHLTHSGSVFLVNQFPNF